MKKIFPLYLILAILILGALSLTACASGPTESGSDTGGEQNEVMIPVVAAGSGEESDSGIGETGEQDGAYPAPASNAIVHQAYPAPEEEAAAIQVTPRGNDLVATDPSTVNLASGQPQLVELFAFW